MVSKRNDRLSGLQSDLKRYRKQHVKEGIKMKFTTIISFRLSNGALLEMTKTGRKYRVMVASPIINEAPEIYFDLTKKEGLQTCSEIIKNDVCDITI